ncbi:MAG: substrate-binding domain-containing protein [Anaerolineales bacterium]|nr:substrate-binding domain-containing protein [Anaerolineales bacterium]
MLRKNLAYKSKLFFVLFSLVIIFGLVLAACTPPAPPATKVATTEPTKAPEQSPTELILATTTSTRDTGLLDVLLPLFESKSGYKVKMVAVGTGQALKMGEEGNADVLLVHSPQSELELMDKGFGKDRLLVMHNDYVIVGPKDDPAGIKGMKIAVDAFKMIAEAKSPFVSRGDDSGTNKMELSLWKSANITPEGDWYLQSGQAMGETLRIASEKVGYTLTDRGTYLALRDTLQLDVLFEGDPVLLNIYHVITVNPDKWPKVNYTGAEAFADFLVSPDTQKLIGEFGVDKFGQPLFIPDAGKAEDEVGK